MEEPGLETRIARAKSEVWNVREGTVGVREEEQRWRDGEQEGRGSPRSRIETAWNPGRTQTYKNWRQGNIDNMKKEAMGTWGAVRVAGR